MRAVLGRSYSKASRMIMQERIRTWLARQKKKQSDKVKVAACMVELVCADLFGRFSCSLISGCKKLNSCGRAVQGTVVLYLFIFPYEQTTLLLLLVLDNRVYYCCHEGKLETYVHGQTVVV